MALMSSLFMLSDVGDVFFEKHWRQPLPRAVLEPLLTKLKEGGRLEDTPPAIHGNRLALLNIYRGNFFTVAVVQQDTPPLAVFEFLYRVLDTLSDYFGPLSQDVINNNCVMIFEVLEEMMDNGVPLSTENNVLKELIHPPSVLKSAINAVSGKASNVAQKLPTGQLTNIPWRRSQVWYTTNEIYVDVIERLDCIVDANGSLVCCDILGNVGCTCQLSGVPELVMSFSNPRVFENVGLHPCVRYRRWEQERVLSFVPPDGRFGLMNYRMDGDQARIPLQFRPYLKFTGTSGVVDISISRKHLSGDKAVEGVSLHCTLPHGVCRADMRCSHGSYTFNPLNNLLTWEVGKISSGVFCSLKGTATFQPGSSAKHEAPNIVVQFKVPGMTFSGLQVARLEMYNETHRPFKGVKYTANAGQFIVRTG